jgi:hypothetical protein
MARLKDKKTSLGFALDLFCVHVHKKAAPFAGDCQVPPLRLRAFA